MDSINNLIFNALVRRQGINLPGIGSLNVISESAQMKKKGVLIPPSTRIELSGNENPAFENIIDQLATENGLDQDVAMEIYTRWLENSRSENVINIMSVGEIKHNFFTPSEDLSSIINPTGGHNVTLSKNVGGNQIALWVIVAIILGGIISTGAIFVLEKTSDNSIESSYVETVDLTPITPSTTTPSDTIAPSATAQTNPSSATSSLVTPGMTGYYVVIGCYSTETNANKFVSAAQKVDATINYKLLPLRNGKFMVYTSVSTTESEAEVLKSACSKTFEEAWVYKCTVR